MARKKSANWFAVVIATIAVAAVVGVGALVVVLNNRATAPGVAPEGAIINSETGAISFGSGSSTVATYVDFMCPACGSFEANFGEALNTAAESDEITLQVHPIAILDHQSQGTSFSSRAASALYCVATEAPDAALEFQMQMFVNQPSQGSAGLSNAQITAIAESVGAGAAASCIDDGTYMKFVQDRTPETPPDPETMRITTPTVVIDDERIPGNEVGARLAQLLGIG